MDREQLHSSHDSHRVSLQEFGSKMVCSTLGYHYRILSAEKRRSKPSILGNLMNRELCDLKRRLDMRQLAPYGLTTATIVCHRQLLDVRQRAR